MLGQVLVYRPCEAATRRFSVGLVTDARGQVTSAEPKAIVRRLVDEVINAGRLEVIADMYTAELADGAKRWIAPFRAAFPDVHMDIVELIAEGDTGTCSPVAKIATDAGASGVRRRAIGKQPLIGNGAHGSRQLCAPLRGGARINGRTVWP
jgi:hypothetical protein